MYLSDTNIFLEALLKQERASSVYSFFERIPLDNIFISDLSMCSIGIILFKQKRFNLFDEFVNDMIVEGMQILSLYSSLVKILEIKKIAEEFNIDFDDAYQYSIAKKYNLQLISFDKDFDRTDLKRMEPSEILKR